MGSSPFTNTDISFIHSWLIDPESSKYAAVSHVKDYDSAINLIVKADVLMHGLLMGNDTENNENCASSSQTEPGDSGVNLSKEERQNIKDGELPYVWQVPASLMCTLQLS